MKTLSPERYGLISDLVRESGMRGHLPLVYEVLEKRVKGRVFVDDPDHLNTALVCNANGFYFSFGRPDVHMLRPLINQLWQEARRDIYACLFGSTVEWNEALDELFEPYPSQLKKRLAFELHGSPPDVCIPEGFRLEPITDRLAQSIVDGTGTRNYGIDPWFVRIAGGPQAYAALGLGLALTCNGEIASLCGLCGLSATEVEMEVGTVPAYQGRGLAVTVSAAFIQQCIEKSIQPCYSCDTGNTASIAVARRLGFVPIEEIQGYLLFEV